MLNFYANMDENKKLENLYFSDKWTNSICWGRLCDMIESFRTATKETGPCDGFVLHEFNDYTKLKSGKLQ